MRLRVARKVLKAIRWGRHPRDTVRRAALRAWASPLQITGPKGDLRQWTPPFRGRAIIISPKCGIYEQPRRLFDVKRRGDRLELVPRG